LAGRRQPSSVPCPEKRSVRRSPPPRSKRRREQAGRSVEQVEVCEVIASIDSVIVFFGVPPGLGPFVSPPSTCRQAPPLTKSRHLANRSPANPSARGAEPSWIEL